MRDFKHIKFIKESNIFELLGLESLPEEKKDKYLMQVTIVTLQKAMQRFLEGENISDEEMDRIDQEMDRMDPIAFQDEIQKRHPELAGYIDYETYLFKKNGLIHQINERLEILSASRDEVREYDIKVLTELKDKLSRDEDVDFPEIWQLYKKIKAIKN